MKKILCTTDNSDVSKKAEVFAAELAKALGSELHFVHVTRLSEQELKRTGSLDIAILTEQESISHDVLQRSVATAKEHGVTNVIFLAMNGLDVAKAIIDYAEMHNCDHIVTGSNARVGIPRLVMGSVSSDIIHRAHCPVTVIR
jgi:nucleotide-binding universal stress UspA family protein